MEPKKYSFEDYENRKVKIEGTFLYFPESCIIFNMETKKEFMLERDEKFLEVLSEGDIGACTLNEDVIYIYDPCVLYGRVQGLLYTYILKLHEFRKI